MKFETDFGFITYSPGQEELDIDQEGEETVTEIYTLIDLVYVKPEYRRQGYARKMMDELLSTLSGKIKLVAEPKEDSIEQERLCAFYASLGFCTSDIEGPAGVIMEMDK